MDSWSYGFTFIDLSRELFRHAVPFYENGCYEVGVSVDWSQGYGIDRIKFD